MGSDGSVSTASPPAAARACQLTARELSVTELVALGYTNRLIARRLSISCHTVDQHVRSALEKVGAASRAELIALLYVLGVFDPAAWPPSRSRHPVVRPRVSPEGAT